MSYFKHRFLEVSNIQIQTAPFHQVFFELCLKQGIQPTEKPE